jgi:prevent-host-death family protein
MRSIGVRELKERASRIVRQVREERTAIDITVRGRIVARIVPVEQQAPEVADETSVWSDIDTLAAEIGERWPRDIDAVTAVREMRREL